MQTAHMAIDAANLLMGRSDYKRAARFSAAAARSGAEWAVQAQIYPAEGLGNWDAAEKYCRQAADAYGNTVAWFTWCIRTGHGDVEAARKQYLAGMAPQTDDPTALQTAAIYDFLTGDDAKAQPILKRLWSVKHNGWGALQAAIYAGEHGDTKTRDAALGGFAGISLYDSEDNLLPYLADQEAKSFATNKPLDLSEIDQIATRYADYDNAYYANVYYLAGRLLILQGQTDQGIKCLKRAAAHNGYGASRALATLYLRNHHLPIPLPGSAK
jgi:tetratricopeptide (TPR) repeat protein